MNKFLDNYFKLSENGTNTKQEFIAGITTFMTMAYILIVNPSILSAAGMDGPIPLPTKKEAVTILRAVHKYKDSREQFEQRTHKRLIDIIRPSAKTVEALTGLELPAGVEIEIKL